MTMGTFVEPMYVQRLQDDIKIACEKLEEHSYESLVVIICKGSEYSYVTGSHGGERFLEDKQSFITDFMKFCSDDAVSSNPPEGSGKPVNGGEKLMDLTKHPAPIFSSPKVEYLNTPIAPNNVDIFNDDINGYDDTELFESLTLMDTETERITTKNDGLKQDEITPTDQSKINSTSSEDEMHESFTDIDKNKETERKLPKVKIVLKRLEDSKDWSRTTQNEPESAKLNSHEKAIKKKGKSVYIDKENSDSLELSNVDIEDDKEHTCDICKKAFSKFKYLEVHITEKHYEAGQKCQQCQKTFESSLSLGEHIEKEHELAAGKERGYFTCNQCSFVFSFNTHLLEHNHRNPNCKKTDVRGSSGYKKDNILQSVIKFVVGGEIKKKTMKELLENKEMPNTCEICQKSYDRPYSFRRHILQHSSVKPYICNICCSEFNMEESLKRHWKLHDSKPYYCVKCFERYDSQVRLNHHVRISCKKTQVKPDLQCTMCRQQCVSKSALEIHQRVHTGVKEWGCDACGKQLVSKESLWRHRQVFHQDDRPYGCTQCEKKFKSKDTVKKHMLKHGERKFKCEECDYAAFEGGHLKKHMRTHTKEMPFICDFCGKRYGRKFYLDNHLRLHTGEKPYQCDFEGCDKAFRNPLNLKQHKFYHSTSYACICDVCGKQFKVPSQYRHHRKIHMVDFRWPCEYCEDKFKSLLRFKTHILTAHKEKTKEIESQTNIRFYQCNLCPKMFAVKDHFEEHMNTHLGLRPNKCRFCGKGFSSRGNMLQHEKSHTGGKKFRCNHCSRKYNDPDIFKQHLETKHPSTILLQFNNRPDNFEESNLEIKQKVTDETVGLLQEAAYNVDTYEATDSINPGFSDFLKIPGHLKNEDTPTSQCGYL